VHTITTLTAQGLELRVAIDNSLDGCQTTVNNYERFHNKIFKG